MRPQPEVVVLALSSFRISSFVVCTLVRRVRKIYYVTVAASASWLQCVVVCWSLCCSVLQCVAVFCHGSVLQWVQRAYVSWPRMFTVACYNVCCRIVCCTFKFLRLCFAVCLILILYDAVAALREKGENARCAQPTCHRTQPEAQDCCYMRIIGGERAADEMMCWECEQSGKKTTTWG